MKGKEILIKIEKTALMEAELALQSQKDKQNDTTKSGTGGTGNYLDNSSEVALKNLVAVGPSTNQVLDESETQSDTGVQKKLQMVKLYFMGDHVFTELSKI